MHYAEHEVASPGMDGRRWGSSKPPNVWRRPRQRFLVKGPFTSDSAMRSTSRSCFSFDGRKKNRVLPGTAQSGRDLRTRKSSMPTGSPFPKLTVVVRRLRRRLRVSPEARARRLHSPGQPPSWPCGSRGSGQIRLPAGSRSPDPAHRPRELVDESRQVCNPYIDVFLGSSGRVIEPGARRA